MFGFSFYLKLIICSAFKVWKGRKTRWPLEGARGRNENLGGFVYANVTLPGHCQFVDFTNTHITVWEGFAQSGTYGSRFAQRAAPVISMHGSIYRCGAG